FYSVSDYARRDQHKSHSFAKECTGARRAVSKSKNAAAKGLTSESVLYLNKKNTFLPPETLHPLLVVPRGPRSRNLTNPHLSSAETGTPWWLF
ncbi:MAG: hypothetical protein QMB08_06490, partial [Acidimicrobiales bacterium]